MGTHPIFESDFDCLTDNQMLIGLLLGVAVADDNERHRDFVIAMWRHGARSPMVFQPAFGDDLNMWPDGAGQLTAAGRDLHLELGECELGSFLQLYGPRAHSHRSSGR